MAITLQPESGSTLDLVSLSTVQTALAAVLPSDTSFLASLITAASLAVQRWCRRWFNAQTFIEIRQPQPGQWDKGENDLLMLGQYPIIGTPMLRGGLTNALLVSNTSNANQEAYVGFTTSGDPQISLTNTGLSLTSVASGVQTVATVAWTTTPPYTTLQGAMDSINALSAQGWTATLQSPSLAGLGAYQLYGSTAYADALTAGGGAMLSVFQRPLRCAGVEADTGMVWLAPGAMGGGYGAGASGYADWMFDGGSPSGGNYRAPVLCQYVGGFSVIPQDVQTATCLVIKALLQATQTNTTYQSETVGDWSGTLAEAAERVFPAEAKKLLSTYRAYRVS